MNFDDRPGPINAICLIWTLYIGYDLYHFVNAQLTGMPEWFFAYYIAISCGQLIAIVGYWQMRRWGVLLFTSTIIIGQAVLIGTVGFNPTSLILPLIVLMVGMAHYNEMN